MNVKKPLRQKRNFLSLLHSTSLALSSKTHQFPRLWVPFSNLIKKKKIWCRTWCFHRRHVCNTLLWLFSCKVVLLQCYYLLVCLPIFLIILGTLIRLAMIILLLACRYGTMRDNVISLKVCRFFLWFKMYRKILFYLCYAYLRWFFLMEMLWRQLPVPERVLQGLSSVFNYFRGSVFGLLLLGNDKL